MIVTIFLFVRVNLTSPVIEQIWKGTAKVLISITQKDIDSYKHERYNHRDLTCAPKLQLVRSQILQVNKHLTKQTEYQYCYRYM